MNSPEPLKDARWAFVFSHPNHELAVYGLIQWLDPRIIFLTDGGGEDRVAQTRAGLGRIGRLQKAVFLNHAEGRFYQALLDRDAGYFSRVAGQVREVFDSHPVDTVCSDAIEFYNPVHDLATPIVRSAISGTGAIKHHEVPLVHQQPGPGVCCVIQRLPENCRRGAVEHRLDPDALEAKVFARDNIYTILARQFGTELTDLPAAHLGLETLGVAPATGLREPGNDYVLRYEWRAERLLREGAIREKITFAGHYLPVATRTLNAGASTVSAHGTGVQPALG